MSEITQDIHVGSKSSRSTAYYFQNVIIKVEGCLYSIPKQALISQSPVFEGMFDGNNDGGGEGATDEKPIVLEGYKSVDFECLLKVMLPQPLKHSLPVLAKEEWTSVLKLSTVWQMDKIRQLAIEQLTVLDLTPIEKILHAREYRVLKWLTEGVSTLAAGFSEYKFEDIAKELGWETTARILSVRDEAKPKVPESNDRIRGWKCWNHNREVKKPDLLDTSHEASGNFAVPPDVVSTVFADEIKALQG
ncbi:hypothetical protein BKA70DRAFT_1562575 [Coprinopsis sp. MPI-PUGE-AT-0042]|nr:hypothetical protein BKA70DRAFT_1562575 [Coprinopsis sp. MPI-PUGE-AT-0042]